MSRPPIRSSAPLPVALRLLPPLAAMAAIASLAAGQRDPAAAVESSYLALAAGIVLLSAAAVAPGGGGRATAASRWISAGSVAVTALAWTMPAGSARGAVVTTAGAAVLVGAALLRTRAAEDGGPAVSAGAMGALLRPVPAAGLAFGLQALLRAGELLSPSSTAWALVVYAALPAAGAVAALGLARVAGPWTAALATSAVLVVGPGFRPATVVALAALAAAPVVAGAVAGLRGPGARIVAAAVLVAPAAWSPSTALLAALAGAALAATLHPRRRAGMRAVAGAVLIAAPGAVGLALMWLLTQSSPEAVLAPALAGAFLVPLAVPAAGLPAAGRDRGTLETGARLALAASALLLAFAAALGVTVDGALAPAAALAGGAVPVRGTTAGVQGAWSGTLLAGGALAAGYPWLRPEPLAVVAAAVGLPGRPLAAALVAVTATVLLAVVARSAHRWIAGPAGRRRQALRAAGALLAAGTVLAALLAQIPRPGHGLVGERPLVLAGPRDSWSVDLGTPGAGLEVGSVLIRSALANAATLEDGTPVATLALRGAGPGDERWLLRAGRETGEWAADRPELAAGGGVPAPRPWVSWIHGEGGDAERPFFGHSYRAVLETGAPVVSDRLELRLRPDLPPDVTLTVFGLELLP